ncbi:hypothetical protein ACP70R_044667 [Stipagrostis hirtigluma subsp. patula]
MRLSGPVVSFRQDAASAMAGAIFMSNTVTRELCFKTSTFGLPIEYESFVSNVKKGMPLFLFDYSLRKLYGVFEAASDGGLNINQSAFRAMQHSYPAQVRVNIIWKCRPLSEDEFFPAIEENYYLPRKFYFDLSYEQVIQLYKLFDDKRVERPIHNCSEIECRETKYSSEGTSEKGSLTQNGSHSNNRPHLLISEVSELVRRYSTQTSMHTVVPRGVEVRSNTPMPIGNENCGTQIAPIHSKLDQTEFPCQSEQFKAASVKNGVSTQVSAPSSLTSRHHPLVASQSYPSQYNHAHNILSSGRITQEPPEGGKCVANQSYPLSNSYAHNSLISSRYVTHPTYGGTNHVGSTTSCPYAPSYPHLSIANSQGNADYQDQCDLCIKQNQFSAHDKCAYGYQPSNEGKALPSAMFSQQGIPGYPEVPEYRGNKVSATGQQKNGSTDYIPLPDCDEEFNNDRMEHALHSNASDSSDLDNDIGADMSRTKHSVGADSNTKVLSSCPQSSVFSRLSPSEQPPSQVVTGPTLSQLVYSLSQKANQWLNNRPVEDDVGKHWVREQTMDIPCAHVELDLPSHLELEPEGTQPEPPFFNFKRRSEAGKMDVNLGKETSGKVKRRKLVRPSFGENNVTTSAGKEHEGKCTENRKQVSGKQFGIDLNRPAPVDNDQVEDNNIVVCPSVVVNIETEELCGVNVNKPNCSHVTEAIKEQDTSVDSSSPAQKVADDFDVAELNTMDESKLQMILSQASFLLQARGKLRTVKSSNSEDAISSNCGKDMNVNMGVNPDGSTEQQI